MILLENPKFIENLAGVIRAAACFGQTNVIWTGNRLDKYFVGNFQQETNPLPILGGSSTSKKARVLREFRMKEYQSVRWYKEVRPFNISLVTPVCVEIVDGAESLVDFVHPEFALYVFGPEDGSVSQVFRRLCHRFVRIPSKHCLNLACAVNVVLAHRTMQKGSLS